MSKYVPEQLTFELLSKLITKYNIPHNVRFMSDSGWECDATDMRGIYYCAEKNIIIFTQGYDGDCLYYYRDRCCYDCSENEKYDKYIWLSLNEEVKDE